MFIYLHYEIQPICLKMGRYRKMHTVYIANFKKTKQDGPRGARLSVHRLSTGLSISIHFFVHFDHV